MSSEDSATVATLPVHGRARAAGRVAGALLEPLAPTLVVATPTVGGVAQNAVRIAYRRFGTAGTEAKIRHLSGLYQDRAVLAAVGGGPIKMGGGGMSAGGSRLAVVGGAATVGVVVLVGASYIARILRETPSEA